MNCKHVYRRDWHCIGCDKPHPLLAENAKLTEAVNNALLCDTVVQMSECLQAALLEKNDEHQ